MQLFYKFILFSIGHCKGIYKVSGGGDISLWQEKEVLAGPCVCWLDLATHGKLMTVSWKKWTGRVCDPHSLDHCCWRVRWWWYIIQFTLM